MLNFHNLQFFNYFIVFCVRHPVDFIIIFYRFSRWQQIICQIAKVVPYEVELIGFCAA